MKKIVLFSLIPLLAITVKAQEQEQNIIPPSPETAALFKYQDYPMDYSTGLPQISIPLFNIKNGSLSVPISISYHASGCKVSDIDGPIGVGWSLNVGGMVSRTIHGDPDFGEHGFPSDFNPNMNTPGQNTLEVLEQITNYEYNPNLVWRAKWRDSEYDIFSYSFGSHNGKFLFKDEAGVKTPVILNQTPLKIQTTLSANGITGLDITDDKGDNYTFVGSETASFSSFATLQYTGFALKRIVSANGKDQIEYTYVNQNESARQYRRYYGEKIIIRDKFSDSTDENPPLRDIIYPNESARFYDINRITEIDFEQGKVEFVLIGGEGFDKELIDFIQLKDRNGKLIKKVKFIREPLHVILAALETTNLQTHKLTGIEIYDNKDEDVVERYSFEHYPTSYPLGGQEVIDSRFIDYWGYYNASGITDMIPYQTIPVQFYPFQVPTTEEIGSIYAKRDPNLGGLKSGVLKKIYYPTGGSTEFEYEHNEYLSEETGYNEDGPGLRVKKIISSDGNSSTITRSFVYSVFEDNVSDYGYIDLEPNQFNMHSEFMNQSTINPSNDFRERIYEAGFVPSLGELAYRPIRYTFVTEYKGDKLDNEGKTVYEYDNNSSQWVAQPLARGYEFNKFHVRNYNYYNTVELLNKTDYKPIKENGNILGYDKVKKVSNSYTSTPVENIEGLHVQRNWNFPEEQGLLQIFNPTGGYWYVEEAYFGSLQVYAYEPYSITVGTKNLASTTETLTNDDGVEIKTATSYMYDDDYNLVKGINTITSRIAGNTSENKILKKEVTYPFHYNIDILNEMSNRNMLNYKVEEKNYLDDIPTSSSKINYRDWDDNLTDTEVEIQPEFIERAKNNDALETRTTFHGYDANGNLQEVSKTNAPHTYYVWGYHGTVPIAKIDNIIGNTMTSAQLALIAEAENASDLDYDNCKTALCTEEILRSKLQLLREGFSVNMVATYTYDPLIGVTSMTDPRGYTIYYEYDDFNRLKTVKDAEGNRVSDYDYSYKQPITN